MVAPEFSEFQFGYGLTRELDDGQWPLTLTGVPFFPTQPEEDYLGFDMGVSAGIYTLFVQFKRARKLTRSNAREWDMYGGEYFRFPVEVSDDPREPDQHGTLVELGHRFPHTYYVAPEFITWRDWERYARNERINRNAVFLRCGSAPAPFDGNRHYICYRPQDSVGLFFSEAPTQGEVLVAHGFGDVFDAMQEDGSEFRSIQGIRGEFAEARSQVVEGLDLVADPLEYTADELVVWMREQQRFFYETLGMALYFLADPPHDS
jgi:hypothetical protein